MSVIIAERAAPGGAAAPPPQSPDINPRGLAFSAVMHVVLLAVAILGLPSLFKSPPPEETPIAVELVTIAPETKATHPNQHQPVPHAKPEPSAAAPAPKPEPKPEPPPPSPAEPRSASAPPPPTPAPPVPEMKPTPPPPPPKPVEAKAPPPPPEPKPKPQHIAAAEPSKANPAAFDKMLKALEQRHEDKPVEKKPEPAAFDALLKNLTKQDAAHTEDAPHPLKKLAAAAAPPSSQPKAPLGSQLTASELDALANAVKQQLVPCWNVPAGARDAKDLQVQVRASLNADGTVRQAVVVDAGRRGDPLYRAAAESARRTFFNPQCTPLKLPADKYEVWKDLVVNFDPKDLL